MADNDYDDLLTDEERAALNDSDFVEDYPDGDGDADAALQDAADTAAADANADGEDDPEAEAAQPEAENAAESVDLGKINTDLEALTAERAELLEKYDDGDLTSAEYKEALDRIAEQSSELVGQRAVAQHAADQENARWEKTVLSYMKAYPELAKGDDLTDSFDTVVRAVTIDPRHASKSFEQQLQVAHDRLLLVGVEGTPPRKKEGAKPAPKAEEKGDDMRTPPPSLARAPASDMSGVVDSPYAALELLIERGDSDQIEAAMARLTPEQRDDFSSRDIS